MSTHSETGRVPLSLPRTALANEPSAGSTLPHPLFGELVSLLEGVLVLFAGLEKLLVKMHGLGAGRFRKIVEFVDA